MALATANSSRPRRGQLGPRCWLSAAVIAAFSQALTTALPEDFRPYAQAQFRHAQDKLAENRDNPELAWQFGRACFDLGEFAADKTERAEIAQQGLAACRLALSRVSNSAAAHYYLGMNLGQLARTKGLGALKLVNEMRQEFSLVRTLDEHFDFAGADRNLGLLYRDAPAVASIGNRSQARLHLQAAVALAPDYPENRLSLIEALLKWGEHDEARREVISLEAKWAGARERLQGAAWAASWADWDDRKKKLKRKIEGYSRTLDAPRNKP